MSEAKSAQDPFTILAGIKQFGLAADGADLRDLRAAILRIMDEDAAAFIRIRKHAHQQGIDEGLEKAAKWHDSECQGGHCGEDTTEKIVRQRRNAWNSESASAIRSLKSTNEGKG